jgi:pyruvate formate lyase activating enzyme
LLLIDLKLMDSEKHRRYTGVGNELILENIRRVAEAGHDFRIRIPLIDGINADDANIEATALFLSSLPPWDGTVHLLPYHDVGKDKHIRMGSRYNPQGIPMATPTETTQQRCRQQLEAHGLRVIIGG